MMNLSFASVLALLGAFNAHNILTVAAADSVAPGSVAEAVATPAQKVVTQIDCSSGFTKSGGLNANIDSKTSAVVLSDAQELTTGDNAVQLVFTECSSGALSTNPSGSTHYGLLSPSDAAQKTCIAIEALAQPNQHFKAVDCSESDDSSQLTQTWVFDSDKNSLQFLGRSNGGDPYALGSTDSFITASPNGTASAELLLQ
ncbi:hypothetical protein MYAM1_003522 [Malassezia yamatoensis]|uniref:Ricin B lectin domain-containing protein n=1 Tax=Malassezia yamatoensis TaxID=253288 RepID=A0AAJ6CIA6_9BASI|nr:hypothetical protein MYAM1_003522 [Malassezia yamatoensis]